MTKRNFESLIIGIITALVIVFCALTTDWVYAQPRQNGEVHIGMKHVGSNVTVCDTADQWARVITEQNKNGYMAATALLKRIAVNESTNLGPACKLMEGIFIITDIVWSGKVQHKDCVLVEVGIMVPPGSLYPVPQYALVEDAVPIEPPHEGQSAEKDGTSAKI